jgi:hypothetical protein
MFGALVEDLDPARVHVHVVRPDLLDRAQLHGPDDQTLGEELRGVLRDFVDCDAAVVVCTCSTLGGVFEQCGSDAGIAVLRVDRGKAGEACTEYLSKAWLVAVDGRIELGQWETEGGEKRHDYSVVGSVEFLTAPKPAEVQATPVRKRRAAAA